MRKICRDDKRKLVGESRRPITTHLIGMIGGPASTVVFDRLDGPPKMLIMEDDREMPISLNIMERMA
jgi:uncharacterized membrane protein YedE/YeeE